MTTHRAFPARLFRTEMMIALDSMRSATVDDPVASGKSQSPPRSKPLRLSNLILNGTC